MYYYIIYVKILIVYLYIIQKKRKTKNHRIIHSTTQIGVKKKTDKMPVFKKAKKKSYNNYIDIIYNKIYNLYNYYNFIFCCLFRKFHFMKFTHKLNVHLYTIIARENFIKSKDFFTNFRKSRAKSSIFTQKFGKLRVLSPLDDFLSR